MGVLDNAYGNPMQDIYADRLTAANKTYNQSNAAAFRAEDIGYRNNMNGGSIFTPTTPTTPVSPRASAPVKANSLAKIGTPNLLQAPVNNGNVFDLNTFDANAGNYVNNLGYGDGSFLQGNGTGEELSKTIGQKFSDGDFGSLEGWGSALEGAGALFGAYNAFQTNKLANEEFGFQKDFANRNMANQASILNADLQRKQSARNQMTGKNTAAAQVNGSSI